MKLLKRVQEFAAFTKNEQKIFLFLSVIFVAGVSIKAYRAYFAPQPVRQFDYSASRQRIRRTLEAPDVDIFRRWNERLHET